MCAENFMRRISLHVQSPLSHQPLANTPNVIGSSTRQPSTKGAKMRRVRWRKNARAPRCSTTCAARNPASRKKSGMRKPCSHQKTWLSRLEAPSCTAHGNRPSGTST
jgi:hypothetical protein